MSLYSHNLNTPDVLPDKIVLSNGFTRTDSATFTDEEIADAGYVAAPDKPQYNQYTHQCLWVNTEWVVSELSDIEKSYIKKRAWVDANSEVHPVVLALFKMYRDTRRDMDENKEPVYLLTQVEEWIALVNSDAIYATYNEETASFSIPKLDYSKVNPNYTNVESGD